MSERIAEKKRRLAEATSEVPDPIAATERPMESIRAELNRRGRQRAGSMFRMSKLYPGPERE